MFVSGGLVGDVVEARVVDDGPSFSRAVVEELLEPSPSRATPPCPFVGVCGGCPWGRPLPRGPARREGGEPPLHPRAHRQVLR